MKYLLTIFATYVATILFVDWYDRNVVVEERPWT